MIFIYIKNQFHPWIISWDNAKILQTFHFESFEHDWPCPPKLMVSTCRKIWCLSAWQKKKIIPHIFLEMLQRYCKLVILRTLEMPGYGQKKRWYQLVESFDIYFHTKIKFMPHLSFEILLRYCKLIILSTLVMPLNRHQKKIATTWKRVWFLYVNLIPHFSLEILHFKESCNLIGWENFGP